MHGFIVGIASAIDFAGYEGLILKGLYMTMKLSLCALFLSLLMGVAGALAKLSSSAILRTLGFAYTTVVRSVPDLVLMLIVFYGLQTIVGDLGGKLGYGYIELDPFTSGVLTLGFIYGAYFAETFRGAILSIPKGQFEAASSYGLGGPKAFIFITFPQMMRNALPGIGNNWQVLLKATALVSLIGLADLVDAAQSAGKGTFRIFFFLAVSAVVYLAITLISSLVLRYLEKRYSAGFIRRGNV